MNKRNNNTKRIEGKKSEAAVAVTATATITITTVAALNGEEEKKHTEAKQRRTKCDVHDAFY